MFDFIEGLIAFAIVFGISVLAVYCEKHLDEANGVNVEGGEEARILA